MIDALKYEPRLRVLAPTAIVTTTLFLSAILAQRSSAVCLALLVAAGATIVLLLRPAAAPAALILASLLVPFEIAAGNSVRLNLGTLLPAAFLALALATANSKHFRQVVRHRPLRPLLALSFFGLGSLLIGIATWDPLVPRLPGFLLVQLAQWAVFAIAVIAYALPGALAFDQRRLERLTVLFLVIGGILAVVSLFPVAQLALSRWVTGAVTRAPFWLLIAAVAGAQLAFGRNTWRVGRLALAAILIAVFIYTFIQKRDDTSNWVGVTVAWLVVIWLRFPRIRWPLVILVVLLTALGLLWPAAYDFAGGDAEWATSGGSRVALASRVIEVTLRNPITGLGPAAYREYARMQPLPYGRAYWIDPQISAHNNYVDIFAQTGVLGLAMFAWFVIEVFLLAFRLRRSNLSAFGSVYVNGMIAAWSGSLTIMMLADWILPFVYNIGFHGFQASVLVWLFLGGLIVFEPKPGLGADA